MIWNLREENLWLEAVRDVIEKTRPGDAERMGFLINWASALWWRNG